MCGIAGYIAAPGKVGDHLRPMTAAISHRGPDDEGFWKDEAAGVALGHRRLSIIDLSASGHQPMASRDGRYFLTYNGEIYNYAALRRELEEARLAPTSRGGSWRGHSDTEILLECIAAWGLAETLKKCVGMFALALWDKGERKLQLARDRFGEKPLYFGWSNDTFMFGSELKTLRAHPAFDRPVDRTALKLLAARTYIPAPLSIYKGIYKLQPGCILTASAGVHQSPIHQPHAGLSTGLLRIDPYWSYREVVAAGLEEPIEDEEQALRALEEALVEAVKGQSVADVPVGTFLSGGIDSSTVAGLLQKHTQGQIRTFSIGFEQAGYNEAVHAKQVAAHLGTDHHERYVTVDETRDVIPLLPRMYDEPFADSSQIPTYLVSTFAREQVKVALSGDGGDELFGGYNRYVSAARMWALFARFPEPLRCSAARAASVLPPTFWNKAVSLAPGGRRADHFGTKVQKGFQTIAKARKLPDLLEAFLDQWPHGTSPVLNDGSVEGIAGRFDLDVGRMAPDVVRMMYCDGVSYLPDDILCKVDRASMAVSLETRVPFLDHRVAAVAARIPVHMKIRNGQGKWILRQILYRIAPRALFERPKAGFAVPVGQWIRGPLREWAEDLLCERRLRQEGYFEPTIVRNRWAEHLSGKRDDAEALWPILMFQAWHTELGA